MDKGQVAQASPEKKLLKIIEGSGDPSAGSRGAVKSASVKKFSPAGILSGFKFKLPFPGFHPNLKGKISAESVLSTDIKKINSLLMVIVAVFLAYFLFNFMNYRKGAGKDIVTALGDMSKVGDLTASFPRVTVTMSHADTLEALLNIVKKRDYFKPITKQQKKAAAEKTPVLSSQAIEQATENLRLVGISLGANPDDSCAMIEDMATKITYFAKKDQIVLGVKIAAIEKDKVIISLNDMEKELR